MDLGAVPPCTKIRVALLAAPLTFRIDLIYSKIVGVARILSEVPIGF